MADKKISALTAATTPLSGSEVLPIVQSGATVKVSVNNLTTGKPVTVSRLLADGAYDGNAPSTSSVPIVRVNEGGAVSLWISGRGYTNMWMQAIQDDGSNNLKELLLQPLGGPVTIGDGNLVIGTAGKGIDFSANTHAAGMTSELLNDYEEGTWTATISDGTTDATMNASRRTGTYNKVGRQVTVTGYIATTSMTGVTGNLRMKGLPFTAGNNDVGGGAVGYADQMTLIAGQVMVLQTQNGADYIVLRYWNGGTTSNMTGTQWGAIGEIGFTLTYFV